MSEWVLLWGDGCMFTCMWRLEVMSGIFLYGCLRLSLSLYLEPSCSTWPAWQQDLWSLLSITLVLGLQRHIAVYVAAEDLNSGPHT